MKSSNPPPVNLAKPEDYYMGKGAFVEMDGINGGRLGYLGKLAECIEKTQGSTQQKPMKLEAALSRLSALAMAAHKNGGKVIFIGNGGSAAIASHMVVDWNKNKGIRAMCLNDAAMLTALGNDFGYEQVFAKQLQWHGRKADIAIIVSSSGQSPNILAAADAAREIGIAALITMSGMNPNNKLRKHGDLSFYTPCTDYGMVELTHLALLHSVSSA